MMGNKTPPSTQRCSRTPSEMAQPPGKSRSLRVLVVDDDLDHCDLIKDCLLRIKNDPIEVSFAHTVADACRLLRESRYDCVLLDHNLPDGHGIDVLEQVGERLLTTAVIGLSASRDPQVAIADFRGGCIDFIAKHEAFRGETLKRRIEEALSQSHRRAIAAVMDRRQRGHGVADAHDALIRAARTDRLMNICNRAVFDDYHADLHRRVNIDTGRYALCLVDVDNFKKYNDHYGHAAGDEVLRSVAEALRSALRENDFIARYGGEEIIILLENVAEDDVVSVTERLRASVEDLGIPHVLNANYGKVTVSVGAALYSATIPEDESHVLKRADGALYKAKATGRNRTFLQAQRPHGDLPTGNAA